MGYLDNKVAIVTGAAVGIGNALARALAAEGADVAVCDIRPEIDALVSDIRTSERRALAFHADVSKPADVRRVVDGTIAELGGVDVLVNNAGIYPFTSIDDPLEKALADFELGFGTHLRGEFLFGRAVMPSMIARGGGDIVNVVTDHHLTCGAPNTWSHDDAPNCRWGAETPRPTGTPADVYDSSKVAINGLTFTWANELRPYNIRVNGLCMGATDSFMLRGFHERSPFPPEEVAKWMRPEDIGRLMLDLIKDGRTGENIGAAVGHPVKLPKRQPAAVFAMPVARWQ